MCKFSLNESFLSRRYVNSTMQSFFNCVLVDHLIIFTQKILHNKFIFIKMLAETDKKFGEIFLTTIKIKRGSPACPDLGNWV